MIVPRVGVGFHPFRIFCSPRGPGLVGQFVIDPYLCIRFRVERRLKVTTAFATPPVFRIVGFFFTFVENWRVMHMLTAEIEAATMLTAIRLTTTNVG